MGRFFSLVGAEFEQHPGRTRTALRTGFICMFGFGLMAAVHDDALLAPYVLWTVASSGGAMIGPRLAIRYIVVTGAMLALSIPVAASLSEAPWLMLPALFAIAFASRYILSSRRLPYPWIIVEIVVLTNFYLVIFKPYDFGTEAAATFGGVVISFLLACAFDTVFWPVRADPELLKLLSRGIARTRIEIRDATAMYFLPISVRERIPIPAFISEMPSHLALLQRVREEGASEHRISLLLAAITHAERLRIDADRLVLVTRQTIPGTPREPLHAEIDAASLAIQNALAERESELMRGEIVHGDLASRPRVAAMAPALSALEAKLGPGATPLSTASPEEAQSIAAFVALLRQLGERIQHGLEDPAIAQDERPAPKPSAGPDPEVVRYSLKVALSVVVAFVVGITSQREDLSVIITTVLIAGLPTYGGTFNKMTLRLAGNALGGAMALLAIILVTPNFETLPVYMIVSGVGLFIAAYLGLGNGRLAYAGRQMGSAFVFTWAGLSPSEAIYTPLYRVWGILLGVAVLFVVFMVLWPEYAGESMLPRLRKILRGVIELVPGSAVSADAAEVHQASLGITRNLIELLAVADDARVEGAASRIDPDSVIGAAGTLRRISHRLAAFDLAQLDPYMPWLDPDTEAALARTMTAIRERLSSWRDHFESDRCRSSSGAAAIAIAHSHREIEAPMEDFAARVFANSYAALDGWPTDKRLQMILGIGSLRRIAELLFELDGELASVAVIPRGHVEELPAAA